MEGTMSAADIAAVTNRHDYGYGGGFFGGEGIWLFAILALMWGGNGGLFGGNGFAGRTATVEDLANQSNFTRLESQVQANGAAIKAAETNLGNGICNLGYQLATDFGALSKEVATCCCTVERALLENRYLAAQNTAEINANVTAQVQKVLDKMSYDKEAELRGKIQALELNQALCGVVRYPNTTTYSAGHPFSWGWGSGSCNGF